MKKWISCFDKVYDVAIFGSGCAGFAAALRLAGQKKRVLLINRDGALVRECGRVFLPEAGICDAPEWGDWQEQLETRGAVAKGLVDGSAGEITATDLLAENDCIDALYYVSPVAVQTDGKALAGVVVGSKSGLRMVFARQWIDATDSGELLRLLEPEIAACSRQPESRRLHLYLQNPNFPEAGAEGLLPTCWENQRRLLIETAGAAGNPRALLVEKIEELRATFPESINQAVMTHCSVFPDDVYASGEDDFVSPVANLVSASAAFSGSPLTNLAERFQLGLTAADALASCASASPAVTDKFPEISFSATIEADVFVAGAGTGGALAALASARNGAQTVCADLMPFAGGVGSGGGINGYCAGAPGGLFMEIDKEALALRKLFGCGQPVGGWHHETKKIVFDEQFAAAGVEFLRDTIVFGIEHEGRRIVAVHVAGENGALRVRAKAFIDGTGDADLARMLGAEAVSGRPGDGACLTFSQVAGKLIAKQDGTLGMGSINYDAGHIDSTDPEDFTRGRISGIRQFLRERYTATQRFCYLAPVIGMRQSVHICSDRDLTVADLVEHREFFDSVGPTYSYLDTHAVDFEFDDDATILWLWTCRNFRGKLFSDLPYRMLLPRSLDNLWIGCRAAGMTISAAYAVRMERDIQRLGEAAGTAAAIAPDGESRAVDIGRLRDCLRKTGAIGGWEEKPAVEPSAVLWEKALEALRAGHPCGELWYLCRTEAGGEELLNALHSKVANSSFLAAALLAHRQDARGVPRLLEAIESREMGPEADAAAVGAFGQHIILPNWLLAVSLLRLCGDEGCLATLLALSRADEARFLNVRTAIALTIERILTRLPEVPATVPVILDRLTADLPEDAVCPPSRSIDLLLRGEPQLKLNNQIGSEVHDDHSWQLQLVVARIRRKLGLPSDMGDLVCDDRAFVRAPALKLV